MSYFADSAIIDNLIILPCRLSPILLQINIETHNYEILKLNGSAKGYSKIIADKGILWLASDEQPLLTRYSDGNCTEYDYSALLTEYAPYTCYDILLIKDTIFIYCSNKLLQFDIGTCEFLYVPYFETLYTNVNYGGIPQFPGFYSRGNTLCTYNCASNSTVAYNAVTREGTETLITVSNDVLKEFRNSISSSNQKKSEIISYQLPEFIEDLRVSKVHTNSESNVSAGEMIYKYILKQLR
jgi:hypothetical protein